MYKKTLFFALSMLLMAAVGVSAYPGHQGQGQGHYQDLMAGLTKEQQDKVKQLTDAHHEKLFVLNKELEGKGSALEALFAVVPPDKAAIEAEMVEINALQAQKSKLNVDYRLDLMEVTGKPVPMQPGKGCGPKANCPGARCDSPRAS